MERITCSIFRPKDPMSSMALLIWFYKEKVSLALFVQTSTQRVLQT